VYFGKNDRMNFKISESMKELIEHVKDIKYEGDDESTKEEMKTDK